MITRTARVKDLVPGAIFKRTTHNFSFKVFKKNNRLYWKKINCGKGSKYEGTIDNPESWISFYTIVSRSLRNICNHD